MLTLHHGPSGCIFIGGSLQWALHVDSPPTDRQAVYFSDRKSPLLITTELYIHQNAPNKTRATCINCKSNSRYIARLSAVETFRLLSPDPSVTRDVRHYSAPGGCPPARCVPRQSGKLPGPEVLQGVNCQEPFVRARQIFF